MSLGVLYIAVGDNKYLEEASISARTLKKHNPEIDVAVITDSEEVPNVFDEVILDNPDTFSWEYKIEKLTDSPYDKTLHLDTDSYIIGDLENLFQILDRFDFAAPHNPVRIQYELEDVPESFPEANGGVFLYRNNEDFEDFTEEWIENYDAERHPQDQPALRKTLFETDLRTYRLPPEYNCRPALPGFLGYGVKIVHGRIMDFDVIGREKSVEITDAVQKLSNSEKPRVHYRRGDKLKVKHNIKPLVSQIKDGYTRYGIGGLFKRAINKLVRREG